MSDVPQRELEVTEVVKELEVAIQLASERFAHLSDRLLPYSRTEEAPPEPSGVRSKLFTEFSEKIRSMTEKVEALTDKINKSLNNLEI